MKDDVIIYSLKVCKELINKGFQFKRSKPNVKYPQFNVYYFERTPALEEEVKKLSKQK